jgi:hypothetical protein
VVGASAVSRQRVVDKGEEWGRRGRGGQCGEIGYDGGGGQRVFASFLSFFIFLYALSAFSVLLHFVLAPVLAIATSAAPSINRPLGQ